MPREGRPARLLLPTLAIVWLVSAVLLSPWVLPHWTGGDPAPRAVVPLALLSGSLLALAVATWFGRRHGLVTRLNILAVSAVLLGPMAAEAALRISLGFEGSPTRQPIRFGHNLLDDDYWILAGRWKPDSRLIAKDRVQPELGWCQTYPAADNPLGINRRVLARLREDGRPKVLFYGDSYVAGHSRPENQIVRYMDERLPSTDVLDLGVGGYGTGQSHLLYERTADMVDRPLVIMSAMVYDLDRSTLEVRDYQKPRLRLDDSGALEVTNVPIEPDPRRFFDDAELSFRSYALQAMRRYVLKAEDPDFQGKLELNRAILAATAERAKSDGSELLYVLFHPLSDLVEPDYRSTFFREALDELGIECFDTRDPLLAYLNESGAKPGDLYVTGHHNDLGNQVIAEALLEALRARGLE